MSALKNASHDGDSSGDEGNNGDKDSKTAEEEDDWMKTFESMKKQYMSKTEAPVVKSEKFVRRQNVALIEVMFCSVSVCVSLCFYLLRVSFVASAVEEIFDDSFACKLSVTF